jgi:hypothetical protein
LAKSLTYNDTDSLPNNTDNSSTDSSNSENSQNSLANDLLKKMTTKNSATNGYKIVNYARGDRDQISNLDSFFSNQNPLDQPSNGYASGTDGKAYASYTSEQKGPQSDAEKFDASALLPQEQNDWFDDPQSKKNINSPHLINIYRPTAVNTIQNTLKNASWDIRGAPPNPKYVVSPWQNSSYEPDTNLKNGSLCV